MKITKRDMPIRKEKELEDLKSIAEDQKAYIDYLSMMSGIELPKKEDDVNEQKL